MIWTPETDYGIFEMPNSIWMPERLPSLQEFLQAPSPLPDVDKNMLIRAQLRYQCDTDLEYRAAEMEMCRRDPVRFFKYWLYVNEPRATGDLKDIPYVPYEFQEWLIWYMWNCIAQSSAITRGLGRNVVFPKARDMAASWTMLGVFLHRWLFYRDSFLLISATFEKVDDRGNKGCLFEKLRYMLRMLPDYWLPQGFKWTGPGKHDTEACLINPTGGEIVGEATTRRSGRSNRVTALGMDELATVDDGKDFECWSANSATTNLRFAISTPDGPDNLFGQMGTGEFGEACDIIRLEWFYHPEKIHTFDPPPLNAEGKVPPDWRPDPDFKREMDLKLVDNSPVSQWFKYEKARLNEVTFAKEVLIDFNQSKKGGVWSSEYNIHIHIQRGLRPADDGSRLIISSDPGTHWMTSFTQIDRYNRYMIFKDMYWENAHIDKVWTDIVRIHKDEFGGMPCDFIGDAAGAKVNSAMHKGKSEWLYVWDNFGINVHWDFHYTFQQSEWVDARINAMKLILTKLSSETGTARFLIDDVKAPYIHKALSGNYRYETDPYGNLTGKVEQKHPWEDAADSATFPLIFRGLVDQTKLIGKEPKPSPRERGSVSWSKPSTQRRGFKGWRGR